VELSKNDGLLFILGAGKTATTSLCGLLNSHPDVFVMCEVLLNQSHISRYGMKLLKTNQDFLPFFFRGADMDRLENYRRLHRLMKELGHGRAFFGDKVVGIDSGYSRDYSDARVIYSARPLPEWIGKDSVREWFPLDIDVVPFAVQYTKHLVESFLLPRIYHVRMEDFLNDNAGVVRGIWQFLEIDPPAKAELWWETVGHYGPDNPKTALNWWRGHASAAVEPQQNDTKVELRKNAFWTEILPIFDKYYDGIGGKRFTAAEINADLAKLQGLIGRHHQPFESCFKVAASRSHNPRFKAERAAKRNTRKAGLSRLLARIGFG
jgi:hypothetical protein